MNYLIGQEGTKLENEIFGKYYDTEYIKSCFCI